MKDPTIELNVKFEEKVFRDDKKKCNCPNRYLLNGTYMGKYCKCKKNKKMIKSEI